MKHDQPKPDVRQMTAKLRSQVCVMLRLDESNLSPGDQVLVARVGALKLLVSDMEAATLRGERIDVAEYVRASEALEHAVRADRQMADGSPTALEDARQKMREVLGMVAPDVLEEAERSEVELLQERVAELQQENDELREQAPPPPPPAEPAEQPSENVIPFDPEQPKYHASRTPDGRPPAHYLKDSQPREPWCDNSDGVVVAPYFPLDLTGDQHE
jgi:hypothetical protein